MQEHLSIYFENQDLYSSDKHLIEEHPSGFQAVMYDDPGECAQVMKGIIHVLKLPRDPVYVSLHPSDPFDDTKCEKFMPDLKKLYEFFSKVDPNLIKRIKEVSRGWWDFSYGRYDEKYDFTEQTNELLVKYKGQPYLLVAGRFDYIFAIDTFKEKMKALRIERVSCWDTMGISFFLQDLEESTFQRAFENLLEIARINQEISDQMDAAALKYCEEKKPWECIKHE